MQKILNTIVRFYYDNLIYIKIIIIIIFHTPL